MLACLSICLYKILSSLSCMFVCLIHFYQTNLASRLRPISRYPIKLNFAYLKVDITIHHFGKSELIIKKTEG